MKKVMKMRDVNSSDIIPIWEDIRTSSDMDKLYEIARHVWRKNKNAVCSNTQKCCYSR